MRLDRWPFVISPCRKGRHSSWWIVWIVSMLSYVRGNVDVVVQPRRLAGDKSVRHLAKFAYEALCKDNDEEIELVDAYNCDILQRVESGYYSEVASSPEPYAGQRLFPSVKIERTPKIDEESYSTSSSFYSSEAASEPASPKKTQIAESADSGKTASDAASPEYESTDSGKTSSEVSDSEEQDEPEKALPAYIQTVVKTRSFLGYILLFIAQDYHHHKFQAKMLEALFEEYERILKAGSGDDHRLRPPAVQIVLLVCVDIFVLKRRCRMILLSVRKRL
eukprot:GHVS01010409.1.p1 GENE.GHVS01010409.1~~GHVS01010409.1.p1  ORF type:complete len:278 (+),score=28.43 GHVS01010409.1:487-1320(+)